MKNQQTSKYKEYSTKDFYNSVLLKTLGLTLKRLEKGSNKFVTFVFADPKGSAEQILANYWERTLTVEPRLLIENIHELKTRIYAK
ncbi:hypothetical protein COW99_03785 [Candidatus Roizmanbacteria bacterium CG22_combo_CG10-13_8_21_14_all_38_20]|uniref:DUF5659 domain-containing protein n=1 Tax=Candidatus Roizmanbacteria bacterium CG22_combo_CG10-13_8_21_14_all_38_20 TaxID=1974862 RepID=A0A2H0BV07_9BACT|nr:hypothetical protein [Candidatus Microgenomates bacterium]PIP61512.1 MAG: hypothetical protein COW99_03785 [Candidatus Roizmanbacteria bacterium CG22_combo_CG10-13_8_21_14_all_38_20]PJC32278.1 MAG: hypothetical protein CO050_00460 [Candidatus Roizmanbacteria bacterium CG_4_9_14_0_2_um_filter_38_17]